MKETIERAVRAIAIAGIVYLKNNLHKAVFVWSDLVNNLFFCEFESGKYLIY